MVPAVSGGVSVTIGGERTVYTVEHRGNCVLITGSVPASQFATLTKLAPPKSVMSPDVARMYGATFALGLPEDLAALQAAEAPAAIARQRQITPGLSEAATKWLASGERGSSSEAMFSHLTGVKAGGGLSHPSDPGDLSRCRKLLEQVPELQPLLPNMATLSPAWKDLVYLWDDLCTTMDAEAPRWREGQGMAPETYDMIQRATR